MPTVTEIRGRYEGLKTNLLTQTFDLIAIAGSVDLSAHFAGQAKLSDYEQRVARAAEGAVLVENERNRLKSEYVRLDLELRAALEIRVEEIEKELAPQSASAQDLLNASQAAPEALISMFDLAQSAGLEDAVLLAFAAARQNDFEDVIAHTIDAREDLAGLYAELGDAASDLALDPADDRFELFAQPAPTKETILGAPQSDLNVYGQMR